MDSSVYTNTVESNSIYKYKASGYYVLGKEKYTIDFTNVHSIVIDHDYDTNNMPLIFAILNLSSKIIDIIIKNKETGVFIFNIQKCVDNSDMPNLWKDYINDTFTYFLPNDINKTDSRDYENANEGREDVYKEINIGLLSQTLVNNNKKTVNGVIECNNMASAVLYTIGTSRPIVMEPFENNPSFKYMMLPPRNSVAKSVQYLNQQNTFYNTQYRYYMDFDATYLLSSKGSGVLRKGDKINTVMVILRNDYDAASKLQGMTIDENNQYYKIEISGTNVEVGDNRVLSKQYTKVRTTNSSGDNSDLTLVNKTNESNFANKTKQVRAPNDNINLISNSEKNSRLYISINKTDLDGSVFTINKEYMINADEVYKDCGYSGKYLLRRKRELYYKSTGESADEKFTLSVLLTFEKVYEE